MEASDGEHRKAPEDMAGRSARDAESRAWPASSSDVLFRVVDGEALLLDVRSGDYFSLDPLATEIWQRRNDGERLDEISSTIAARYSVDEARVRSDLEEFVAELRDARLWTEEPE